MTSKNFYKKENNLEFEKISEKYFQYVEKATKQNLEFCEALDKIIITSLEKILGEEIE